MRHIYFRNAILSTALLILLTTSISIAHAKTPQPLVIIAEKPHGRAIYTVNSIRTTLTQMIDRVGEQLASQDIQSAKAFILVQSTINLREIDNLTGLMQKIGISNIRYFIFGDDKRHLLEFKFVGRPIPFSDDPDVLSKSN